MSRFFRARQRLQRSLRSYVRKRRLVRETREAAVTSLHTRTENGQATAPAIAGHTVKSQVDSAMNKLGVDHRPHAAVAAIQRGLVQQTYRS
jgi:DNA-binding NarL/FixJ family response regulator